MAARPSIKGSIVASHAEALMKYLAESQLGEQELAQRFAPGDLDVLRGPLDATRWVIEHAHAECYPEVLCWTSQGFCNRMAEEHGSPDLWYWERPRPDVVRFRMNREI